VNGDDYTTEEGDVMPAAWWPVADHIPLTVRYRDSHIPGLPHLAFADEFTASLTVHGPRYLDLSHFTRWNARQPVASPQRRAFHTLTTAFPDVFTTVIGAHGPDAVWLALRLTRLSDPVADALLAARVRTLAAIDSGRDGSS
jgi:hypothetical protein